MVGNPHPVFVDNVPPEKANARAYLPLVLGNADALRGLDGSTFWLAYIHSLRAFFYRDTSDTTSADNGTSVIADANGARWKIAGSAGIYISAAGPLADRDDFDGEDPGFAYYATDESLLYIRLTAGGWSDGIDLTGPAGADGATGPKGDQGDTGPQGPATIAIGTVTTLDPGESATVTNSGDSEDVVLNFGIPKGDAGSGSVDSVNGDHGPDIVLDADDIDDSATANKWATATSVASIVHAATSKTTPVDADELALIDSAASNVLKKLTWANLKATLKTYLDTLYIALGDKPTGAIVGTTDTQTLSGKTLDTATVVTTQAQGDNSTKIASTAFVQRDKRFVTPGGWDLGAGSTKTISDADSGVYIVAYNGTTSTLQLPDGLTDGHIATIANKASGNMAINYTGGTTALHWMKAGGYGTGNRTLAAGGQATFTKNGGYWQIVGVGLS